MLYGGRLQPLSIHHLEEIWQKSWVAARRILNKSFGDSKKIKGVEVAFPYL